MSISINHHREGSGEPVVLLHGVGHHWQAWRPVIALLSGEFDVIACDSPGFGRSAPLPPGIEPTVPAYADAFEWFFAELGLVRPHVAGNSMGGAIALELARRRAIGSACAFSPAGFWTRAELRLCQMSLMALARTPPAAQPLLKRVAATRAGRNALFWQLFASPASMPAEEAASTLEDAWAAPALAPALKAFDSYRFEADDQIRGVPVTVAWGRRDRLLPYRLQAPRARRLIPSADHVAIGTGHVPFWDDPPAVATVIRERVRAARAERAGAAHTAAA